jgi:multidrug efflux system outer membrane protein
MRRTMPVSRKTQVRSAVLVPVLLSLAACTLEPRYSRPPSLPAPEYPQGLAYEPGGPQAAAPSVAPADLGWRDFLTDPYLQQLVELGLRNNRSLRVAMLTVQELRAQYRIQSAALFPQVSGFAERSRSRTPADLSRPDVPRTTESYSVGLSLGWEIDFFGKLRSLRHEALEQYLASAQGRKVAHILIVSEVAQQYLTMLSCDELLRVTDETLRTARISYELVKLQFETGAGSELDMRQAETVVEQAQANRAAQLRARAQAQNALMQLIGVPLPPPAAERRPLSDQDILEDLPAGLPSELLTRRPDVQQAEALLRASNADIGAARAAFFPSISLTGTGGTASERLSGLFKSGSTAWSLTPGLDLPVFTGGANRANLAASRVRREIAIAQYQQVVHAAFREVSDALAARGTFDEEIASLVRLTGAQRRRLELSDLLYRNGESSYLDVLGAQTDLYDAQLVLVSARVQRLTSLVDLYRALGGGWIERTGGVPPPADAP